MKKIWVAGAACLLSGGLVLASAVWSENTAKDAGIQVMQAQKKNPKSGTGIADASGTDTQKLQKGASVVTSEKILKGAGEPVATAPPVSVIFSKESGAYDAFDLTLSSDKQDAVIYYTTDGSDPSDEGNDARKVYDGTAIPIADRSGDENVLSAVDPLLFDAANVSWDSAKKTFRSNLKAPSKEAVDKCTVVRAAAVLSDGTKSPVATNTYFVGDMAQHIEGIEKSCEAAGMDLAVMSITVDYDDLFDYEKGIYVKGKKFDEALEKYLQENSWGSPDCRNLDANYKQKGREWERNAHIDYFESNGANTSLKLQQDCGIRVQGNYSRSDYQKGFRLYGREEYGTKNFKYSFWDTAKDDSGNIIDKYKTLVLRNGGNCAFTTKFSDAYWQSLIKDLNCDTQSARPCAVYLDGEYWGIYILQDDYTDNYLQNKHGVTKEDVVIYKGDAEAYGIGYKLDEGTLPDGVTDESYYFQEMLQFIDEKKTLENDADFQEFAKIVDVQSAIDYYAMEVWINNKWDWPGKNWSMWKTINVDENNPYADGRWRFMVYDVEFGGVSGWGDVSTNTIKEDKLLDYTGNTDKPNVRCFAFLMTNRKFRDAFKTRLSQLTDTNFERENALAVAQKFRGVYEPILGQFFKRFPASGYSLSGGMDGGYASLQCIIDFVGSRADTIPEIVSYLNKYYKDTDTPAPATDTPAPATDTPQPSESAVPSDTPQPSGSVAPSAMPQESAKPSDTPQTDTSSKPGTVESTLDDGTVQYVTTDEDGNGTEVQYQAGGIYYKKLTGNTLAYSARNASKQKKKTSITVPDKKVIAGKSYQVTQIEDAAFSGQSKLKTVTVGSNVTAIGKNAFKGCKNLKKIVLKTKKLKKIGKNAVKGIHKKAVITCASGKVKAYKKLFAAKTGFVKKTMKVKKR